MLLHKTMQTSPSKGQHGVNRPVSFLASRGPIGSIGRLAKTAHVKTLAKGTGWVRSRVDSVYFRGFQGGLIKVPDEMVPSLEKLERGAKRKRKIRVGLAVLATAALTALVWRLAI